MSDSQLRKLAAKALSGDVVDQARALAARVRSEASGLTVACRNCAAEGAKVIEAEAPPEGFARFTEVVTCARCNGSGRVTVSWEERLALMAYCGDGAARELCSPHGVVGDRHAMKAYAVLDDTSLGYWLDGLANRWPPEVLLRSALAAGEAVLKTVYLDDPRIETCSDPDCGSVICLAERALAACRAYVEDPTEERMREWCDLWERGAAFFGLWIPTPAIAKNATNLCVDKILAAARETSEETIRAAASEALAGWALQ